MSQAVLRGVLKSGIFRSEEILVSEPNRELREALGKELQVRCITENSEVFRECQLIFLGVKPFVFPALAKDLRSSLSPSQSVISVMSGVTFQQLEDLLHTRSIVRSMPNTNCLVNQGITFYMCLEHNPELQAISAQIFGSLGVTVPVSSEDMINRGCALYGGGPAYVALFAESLVDASVRIGFSRAQSDQLVKQLLYGCALMYRQSPATSFTDFRAQVTSPQGTTAEALHQFEVSGIRAAA